MDCLCCADGGAGPSSETEFLGSVCDVGATGDQQQDAKFPSEPNRYTLYLIAGCPFAARPWAVATFYGLHKSDAIRIVKCFPAAHEDGWFFEPKSDGEHSLIKAFPDAQFDTDPHHGVSHLRDLYQKAKPGFEGVVSVPLLWDSKKDTAVSNNSLGLAEMLATQMRGMATQNHNVLLFPSKSETPELYQKHQDLVKHLHSNVTTYVYKINSITCGREHDKLVSQYYATLDEFEEGIAKDGPYLMGSQMYFADLILFISLVRLDLAYQWRFGLGRRSVRENYPALWDYQRRILQLPGIQDTVLPRDIMALYFLTPKWVKAAAGKTLPQVPETWEKACVGDSCAF